MPGATNLPAGFLERIPCAMELQRPGGEEKKSSVTDETAPKAAVCPCFDIVTGLILCGVPQFTRVMPVSGGVVKIPEGFVLEHRDMIGRKVTLEPKDSKGRTFEVLLTTRIVGKGDAALVFRTGWQEFRSENRVEEGDLLIFALVALSQFVVYILRGHLEIAKRAARASYLSTLPVTGYEVRKPSNAKRASEKESKETRETEDDSPTAEKKSRIMTYFERRLHANAFTKGQGKRARFIELPQAFLRLHGNEVGDTVELVVSGTRQVWLIDMYTFVDEKIPTTGRRVFLSKGWLQFVEDHQLQQGDSLAFALVAHSKFLVTILERAADKNSKVAWR